MRAMGWVVIAGVLCAGARVYAADDPGCSMLPVKMGSGNPGNPALFQAPNHKFDIVFHKPNPKDNLTVQSEDFEIISKENKKACSGSASTNADVSITANERLVIAVAYDPTYRSLEFIDPETCKVRKKVIWETAAVSFQENRITIDADCQCRSEESCLCQPAQIFALQGPQCLPLLQREASHALTKAQLNVDMDKPSYVSHPKLPEAHVIKEKED